MEDIARNAADFYETVSDMNNPKVEDVTETIENFKEKKQKFPSTGTS